MPIDENSIKHTGFVVPTEQYEFVRCRFGLCNSPAVFERFISHIFRELTVKKHRLMDGVIILSEIEKEGLERVKIILNVARD